MDNSKSKHEALLRKITETERNAFAVLIKICDENFWDAADFLASFKDRDSAESNGFSRAFGSKCNLTTPVIVETDGNIHGNIRRSSIESIPLQLYAEPVETVLHVTNAVEFCSRNFLAYSMKSINRGVFFLVNIIEVKDQPDQYRNGAIQDKKKLICLFSQIGFKIFYYENLTLDEFHQLVDQLTKSRHLRATDSLGNFNFS